MVTELVSFHQLSVQQACTTIRLSRSVYYYEPVRKDDTEVIMKLNGLADEHPGHGFWKMHKLLRRQGHPWNHKKVYRVYTQLKMNLRRKKHKRLPLRPRQPMSLPIRHNLTWSIDFMMDRLYNGRAFKVLNIMDDFNREALAMEIDTGIGSLRLVRTLEGLKQDGLMPKEIRVDNGPEFLSVNFVTWCSANEIAVRYIQPGKPVQNTLIERFNGSYRREVLDRYAFEDLGQAREQTHQWMMHYNYERPHDSLQDMPPHEFALKYGKPHEGHPQLASGQEGVSHIPTRDTTTITENDFLKMPTLQLS
jgi:putative transposase